MAELLAEDVERLCEDLGRHQGLVLGTNEVIGDGDSCAVVAVALDDKGYQTA